jgi:putative phosphoesterase
MKVAILADTHASWVNPTLPSNVVDQLGRVDYILHAGDFVSIDILEKLEKIADTIGVYGGEDEPEITKRLPAKLVVNIAGLRIGLIHGKPPADLDLDLRSVAWDADDPILADYFHYLLRQFADVDVILFGHTHVPVIHWFEGRLFVNPGSLSSRSKRRSYALMEIDHYDIPKPLVEIIYP